MHMLVQLLGVARPCDLLREDVQLDVFRRMWYFVASICFRSTEAYARYLHHPEAMESVRREPLLPLTAKQRGMIGESRVSASVRAQLLARELSSVPDITDYAKTVNFSLRACMRTQRLMQALGHHVLLEQWQSRRERVATTFADPTCVTKDVLVVVDFVECISGIGLAVPLRRKEKPS